MRTVHPIWSKEIRLKLRKQMTKAEQLFWYQTRNENTELKNIRRQVGIGRFIVDFLHPKTKTIIEIDGTTHLSKEEKEYDALRTDLLEHQGYYVIRFSNQEIFHDLERVLQEVESSIKKRA